MKKTRPPVITSANGEAELAVQGAESYQDLLAKDRIETIEEIERGLESLKRGNPKGLEGSFSRGIVSGIRTDAGLIQMDAPITLSSRY